MSRNRTISRVNSCISLIGLLGLALVLLKLFGVAPAVGWSWGVVTAPFTIMAALLVGMLAILGLFFLLRATDQLMAASQNAAGVDLGRHAEPRGAAPIEAQA
jgi:hypothetical protein